MKKQFIYLLIFYFSLSINFSEAQQYAWTQKADYGGGERYDAFSFVIGTKGYAGSGFDASRKYYNDFWEWDQATNVWTQKANFKGVAREGARAFSIGDTGYITSGLSSSGSYLNDLWKYDPTTNLWTQKKSLPAQGRYLGVAFSLLDKGYLGLGSRAALNTLNDLWQYDPSTDSWTQKANFPGLSRGAASRFVINNIAYVGLGSDVSSQSNFKDFYGYDPVSNSWTKITDFPGHPRNGAYSFAINDKGYILGGYDYVQTFPTIFQDFYEYDPEFSKWNKLPDFPGKHVVEGIYFEMGVRGYIGIGSDTSSFYHFQKSFWEYGPVNITIQSAQTNVTCFGEDNGTASVTVSGGIKPFTYLWSPDKQSTSAITGLVAGTYTVVVTDSIGLTASDTVRITQPLKVVASASGNLSVCAGESTMMNASASGGSGPYTFKWDGVATGTTYSITPLQIAKHYLIASDVAGCKADTFFFTITTSQAPVVTISISPTIGCLDHTIYYGYGPQDVILTANTDIPATGYQWYIDGIAIPDATGQTLVVSKGGSYSVLVSVAGACSSILGNTAPMLVNTVDIRCGQHGQKVVLCHVPPGNTDNPQTLCIAPAAVPAHLSNHPDDCLGSCDLRLPHLPAHQQGHGGIDIFPNPVVNDVSIYIPKRFKHLDVQVFDVTGRTLFEQSYDANYNLNPTIDFKEFTPGAYFVSVNIDGERVTRKIVKITGL